MTHSDSAGFLSEIIMQVCSASSCVTYILSQHAVYLISKGGDMLMWSQNISTWAYQCYLHAYTQWTNVVSQLCNQTHFALKWFLRTYLHPKSRGLRRDYPSGLHLVRSSLESIRASVAKTFKECCLEGGSHCWVWRWQGMWVSGRRSWVALSDRLSETHVLHLWRTELS